MKLVLFYKSTNEEKNNMAIKYKVVKYSFKKIS